MNNVFNLAFGDLLADGSIDDLVNSNNGDILKVLTTVIQIIKDFTEGTPECTIMFLGSTKEQTALYHRIVKTYYLEFSKEFTIKGVYKIKNKITIVTFDPTLPIDYLAFLLNGLIKFVNISVTGKNKARKSAVKKQHSPVFIVTKSNVAATDTLFPEKLKKANAMLKKPALSLIK